jgi:hypothetical protein
MRGIFSAGNRARGTRLLSLAAMAVLATFFLSGCYLQLTGGGWMRSVNGVDKATFSVNYDVAKGQEAPGVCKYELTHIRGTYHDHGTDVRFKIDDKDVKFIVCFIDPDFTVPPLDNNCAGFVTSYESQDPKLPGRGHVSVAPCDHGEPGDVDFLAIQVQSGPYAGYFNSGPVLGGNFQGQEPFSP